MAKHKKQKADNAKISWHPSLPRNKTIIIFSRAKKHVISGKFGRAC